ncbi:PEPxxWA-CTERM sorting domain-containing protein [Phenylobacterium sp.]|uniref:PEPxxWA-CTERM sorting domain-containing protein n=1 Tax=Phenylobacterium sp. TaxID=1871053 RepID=UPI00122ACCC2|nr:PEPxxWA-CTERM sorting domain-containing protein [Phenylobacterium sp.]THD63644.1 MAG: PEP-CTERM sorting domain-containing protein [Phenylobacterium sp.]
MRGLVGICAAGLVALGATRAGAVVVFSDNFDEQTVPPVGEILNDNSFVNFNVDGGGPGGTVDLLTSKNTWSLHGSGANTSGNFVDLDGSSNDGGFLQTKQAFSFNAGDTVTLSIDVGGSERMGTDTMYAGFLFSGIPDITGVTTTNFNQPNQTPGQELLGFSQVGSSDPFQVFTISFVATAPGSVMALVGTTSKDNVGPLLDQLTVTDDPAADALVPEPASWALMILGFGGVGSLLRRRRTEVFG